MFDEKLSKRGVTLAELLIVSLIFAMIVGICMFATVSAFRMFQQTNTRQQLQRDAAAVFAWLQRDLEVSNLLLCQSEERWSGTDERYKLGLVGLSSWQEPVRRDAVGHPDWDRVIVYSSTRDQPTGQLIRQSAEPVGGIVGIATIRDFMVDTTLADSDMRRLASGVKSFKAEWAVSEESIRIDLLLLKETVQTGTGGTRREVFEVQTAIRPRNTFPKV